MKASKLWVVLLLLFIVSGVYAAETLFELKEVADGVYIALACLKNDVISNAAIIILDDGVMVVDTHSRPSTARALIGQIKDLTNKPVRYVVNTHFHADHIRGNSAYLEAYPDGLEIICSEPTRQSILHRGLPRIKTEIARYTKRLDSLKRELAGASETGNQAKLKRRVRETEEYLGELKEMVKCVPTMSFEKSMTLYENGREIQLLFFGKGHTNGDIVVYLPKEKVIVSGDLLHGWVPYIPDSYPYEWIKALEEMKKLDFEQIISGHGDVMQGKGMVILWRDYFTDLMTQVEELYSQGASFEEIREKIDLDKYEPHMGLDEAGTGLEAALDQHVRKAYRVINGG